LSLFTFFVLEPFHRREERSEVCAELRFSPERIRVAEFAQSKKEFYHKEHKGRNPKENQDKNLCEASLSLFSAVGLYLCAASLSLLSAVGLSPCCPLVCR
jgi:hypothetical protein